MCCNSQSGRYEFHLQTGSIKLNTQQRHCSLYAVLFNCQTNCNWVKFIVFQKQSHAKRLETWYLYSYSAHLLNTYFKMIIKEKNKWRNQFDLRGKGKRKKGRKKKETLQIMASIDFHYLFCELPGVLSSASRECEVEKVGKMRGGGGVKKSSGSEIPGWLFPTQPCVKLIRQCVMPLIRSMAQATPNCYLPSKLA